MSDATQTPRVAPLGSIGHVATSGKVHMDRTARSLDTAVTTMRLAARGLDSDELKQLSDLQHSVLARFRVLGDGWMKDWQDWFRFATGMHGANTMSKLAEHETNIVCQATQMLGSQLSDLVSLQENIEVNYAYWLKQTLDGKIQA